MSEGFGRLQNVENWLDNSSTNPHWSNVVEYAPGVLICKIIISSALWTLYFTAGLCVGTPTVLIPQWRRENSTVIDDEMSLWIYSCFGFSAIPWVLVVPAFSTWVGRKLPYLISCCSMLLVFLILYFSVEPYHILLSEIAQGYAHACNITITVLIVSEYVNPKYRGVFLTIKVASFFWGIWAANAIGTFFHWRYIAIAGILCSVYSFAGAFHPESPHWLASKGRFESSRAAFRWLRGTKEGSEKELQAIINSQSHYRRRLKRRDPWNVDRLVETISCRQFYLPLILSLVMSAQYHFSGKLVCSTYAVDMIKRITDNESAAYTGMLVLDGVTVIGMYAGAFLSKIFRRRVLYMTSSFIGIAFLFILALYLYLVRLRIFQESNVVSISLLTVYSIAISCGPIIMSGTVTGEIIPMRYQALCYSIQATLFSVVMTLLVKYAPLLFVTFGMDGSFLFYGITSGASTVVLYFYLPETKDKTLLEIEEYFKSGKEASGKDLTDERSVFESFRSKF